MLIEIFSYQNKKEFTIRNEKKNWITKRWMWRNNKKDLLLSKKPGKNWRENAVLTSLIMQSVVKLEFIQIVGAGLMSAKKIIRQF